MQQAIDILSEPKTEPTELTELARRFLPPQEIFDEAELADVSERPGQLDIIAHKLCNEIDRLTAENKELEKDRDAHSKIRQRHLVRCGKQSTLIEELQAELKAKDEVLQVILRNIKAGVVTMQWVKSYIEHALKGDK